MGGSDASPTKNANAASLARKSPRDTVATPCLRSQCPAHIRSKAGASSTVTLELAELGESKTPPLPQCQTDVTDRGRADAFAVRV